VIRDELLQRTIAILRHYEVGVVKLNKLRFELLREDRNATGTVPMNFFKIMQKRFGLNFSTMEHKETYSYFTLKPGGGTIFKIS
jgi:hypothetical protein